MAPHRCRLHEVTTRPRARGARAKPGTATELKKVLGQRLRAARQRSGLLQRELAADRYTAAYVSAIENGLVQPTIEAVIHFAERLGVDPRQLLGGDDRTWLRLRADVALASGDWVEALQAYDDLLLTTAVADVQGELLRGRAEALCRLGRGSEAIRPAAEAASQFEHFLREADALEARYWLAYAHYQTENLVEARGVAVDVLERARRSDDAPADLVSRVLVALSHIETWQGEYRQALAYLDEARAGLEGLDARKRASFLFSLAVSFRDAGDMEGAIRAGTESLAFFSAAKEEAHVASLENNLALAHLRLGHGERARDYAAAARNRAEQLGDERLLAHIAESEAQIAIAAGRLDRAMELLDEAETHALESDNTAALLSTVFTRAGLLRQSGSVEAAMAAYQRSAELARGTASPSRRREIMREFGDAALEAGDQQRAIDLFRQGLEIDPSR